MRFISTRTHGILDYLVGLLLVLAPSLFGFNYGGAETWVPIVLGLSTIVYSLLTIYELGAIKIIPMGVHLGLDFVSGVVLAASPWLFGFADQIWAPHLVLGLFEVVASLSTQKVPGTSSGDARQPRARL